MLYLHIPRVPLHTNWGSQDCGVYIWGCVPVAAPQVWDGVSNQFFILCLSSYSRYAEKLGIGYSVFLTVNSGSVLTTGVLLLCYVTSTSTYNSVRPSLFVSQTSCSQYFPLTFFSTGGDFHSSFLCPLHWSIHIPCHFCLSASLLLLPHYSRLLCLSSPHCCLCKEYRIM